MEVLDLDREHIYFVTICSKDRAWVFGDVVGRDDLIPPTVELTDYGVVVDGLITNIPNCYEKVRVPNYIIMPNHIHMLIHISKSAFGGMGSSRPTLQNVIRAFKSLTTKAIGFSPWQDSYHDHIIRNQKDYQYHVQYIANNPEKWRDDAYFLDK